MKLINMKVPQHYLAHFKNFIFSILFTLQHCHLLVHKENMEGNHVLEF